MLIAQLLVLAILGDSQMAADAHRAGFDFAQEDVHPAGFQLGCMTQGLHGSDLAGHDVHPVFAFTAEISVLHRVHDPLGRSEGLARGNKVFTDFRVPHMAERVLSQAAFLSPRLKLQVEVLPGIQQWLNLLADSGDDTSMEFEAVYRQDKTTPLPETTECRKS